MIAGEVGVCVLFLTAGVRAEDKIEPALEPNEEVLAILNGLGENQSALLPETNIVGEFNELARQHHLHTRGPGGRNFNIKMVWAPERRRALFCGGNHGAPHRLNDAWEFDLAANTWALLYPPDFDDSRTTHREENYDNLVVKDGIIRTRNGGPAFSAHTWWQLTYDPERKAMLWMANWPGTERKSRRVAEAIGADPDKLCPVFHGRRATPFWSFTPATGEWEPVRTEPPHPPYALAVILEYIPDLGGSLYRHNWLYRSETNAWTNLEPEGERDDMPGREPVAYWDPVNKILVAATNTGRRGEDVDSFDRITNHYDPETITWKRVLTVQGADKAPRAHDARCSFDFDPVSGHGILYELPERQVWAYNPTTTEWTKLPEPDGPPPPDERQPRPLAYFDPAHNVLVVNQGTVTWVYRYQVE